MKISIFYLFFSQGELRYSFLRVVFLFFDNLIIGEEEFKSWNVYVSIENTKRYQPVEI